MTEDHFMKDTEVGLISTQNYEHKTYGTARVFLEAGEYTISDLEYQIAFLKGMNAMNKKSMELNNGPSTDRPTPE